MSETHKAIVHQSAQTLLCCGDDFGLMKQAVDDLYRVFSAITGVTIGQLNCDKAVMLPSGKAISTAAAAHCLLEMKRTAVFLRGINNAIALRITEAAGRPVRILYAGTGPYGTLVIPLLSLYKPEELIVDLLDINTDSLSALQKITDAIVPTAFIGEIYCTDATTFAVTKPYDIVISETMLACLKSEPQVAIMQNLIPQLAKDCIFIPEDISIDASLTNPKMENDRMLFCSGEKPPFERISLGNIFKVNRNSLEVGQMRKVIDIPADVDGFPILKLFTTVTVFENEVLSENDSSITLPVMYLDLRKQDATQIEFLYTQGVKPVIESKTHK